MTTTVPPARLIITTLGVFQILAWGSSFYLLGVLAQPIAADTGWPLAAILGGVSLAMLVAGLVSPTVGRIINAQGGRYVMAFSAAAFCAGLLLLAASPTLPVYFCAWAVIGLGMASGLYDPAFATLGRIYGAAARPMITTVTLFGGFASTVCWPAAAVLLAAFGWRWTCAAFAAAHFLLALPAYLWLLPADAPRGGDAAAATPADGVLQGTKQTAGLWMVGAIFASSAVILTLVSTHLVALLQARGITLAEAVAFGTLIGPAQVGARVIELALGKHYHPLWTMLAGVALVLLGTALLWMEYPLIAAALIFYGAGNGIISIARGSVPLALAGSARFPLVMGRIALPSLLAMAAAPTIGAFLIEQGGASLAFGTLAALSACNVVLAIILVVKFRR